MKRNTPLDYAEFLLTHSRTRCELHIYANGVREKLASGYFKPFATHLRAAEVQVTKGNQVIRLERPSNFLKKNKVTWFTKGTLERFVRFVSTPEVLERVKSIDDELSQLEHVRVALSRTFSQSEVPFYTMDTANPGAYQTKGSVSIEGRRSSIGAGDSGADTSKIELLRAMDVRLFALKQEQSEAFSRAIAAGFDSSNMTDLLDFSEHFCAERLREACVQFVGLFRKRNIAQETADGVEPPSVDAVSSDSDMSLESCTDFELVAETNVKGEWLKAVKNDFPDNAGEGKLEMKDERNILGNNSSARTRSRWGPPERIQINRLDPGVQDSEIFRKKVEVKHQPGNYSHQDDIRQSDSGMTVFEASGEFQTTIKLKEQPKRSSLIDLPVPFVSSSGGNRLGGIQQGEGDIRGGMFFSRLHKMAQQVEARRSSEDLGIHFTSVERSAESSGSQVSGYGYSPSLYDSAVNPSGDSPLSTISDGVSVRPQRQENRLVPGHFSAGSISPVLVETPVGLKSGSPDSVSNSAVEHVVTEVGDMNNLEKLGKKQSSTSESSKVKDKQEEAVSTSARRLSVQAAISLFESKKTTVGEPPTKKLVRQESQKGAFQSGSSATEKSVLRRWSGHGIDATDDMQGTASETGERGPEKVVAAENAAQKAETSVEEDSIKFNKLPQSATEKISDQAALQEVPVDASSLQQMPSEQQQSFVGVPREVLKKQSKQELEKILTRSSPGNLRMNAILSSKLVADTLKPAEVTIRRGPMVREVGNKDIKRASVGKEVVDVQVDLEFQENQDFTEQTMKFVPGNVGKIETAPKRLSSPKEDKVDGLSVEKVKVDSLKNETGKSRSAEPDKEPSLILHETPVDLYMQALVMIIDNHHQSSLSLGDEESFKGQRGRFYEHYRRLRNARQRGENPAKRAEREAKLKSMQEILERRKAEMDAGVSRQVMNSRFVKEQEGIAQRVRPINNSTRGEMGEDEVVGQQDGQVFASSHAHKLPKTKVQAARKAAPKLQKSASASRGVMTTPSMSSPRIMQKNQNGTGSSVNQRKVATLSYNGPVDSSVYKNLLVDSKRDATKFFSVCTETSIKSFEKLNGHSQSANTVIESGCAAALVGVHSRTADADGPCQLVDTCSGQTFSSEEGVLYRQAHPVVAVEHVDSDPSTFVNDKLLSVAQNVELLSRCENYSTPGTIIMKHEVLNHRHSSANCNEESCPGFDGLENGAKIVYQGREDAGDFNTGKSLESNISNYAVTHSFFEESRSNAGRLESLNQEALKSLDEEADCVFEDASNDKNILFVNEGDEVEGEGNSQKDQMPLKFNEYEESSGLSSAEKSIELSQSDSNCSPSLLQECTTSTYSDAVASPANSSEENSRTVLATYSPKLSMSPYSPSGSPVSWIGSKGKHPSDHERLSSVPQPSKESARGFKRLLHFGRKSRTSEAISTDGISVSTASEGDDETEEVKEPMRQSSVELFQRARSKDKGRHMNSNKDYFGFQDQGATHSLRSSIPTPPSNFKPRADHVLGGTSLKASRSFFSLSSFRSRGGEGKSR